MIKIIDTDGGHTMYLERALVEMHCPVCGETHTERLTDYIEAIASTEGKDRLDWGGAILCPSCTKLNHVLTRSSLTDVERLKQLRKILLA